MRLLAGRTLSLLRVGMHSRNVGRVRTTMTKAFQKLQLPDDVRKAIVESYYPRTVSAADSARNRAQAAYTVASAIAAALVAAGVASGFSTASETVRIIGLLALAGWITAALMFLLHGHRVLKSVPIPTSIEARRVMPWGEAG
jgi:hypothetical protein